MKLYDWVEHCLQGRIQDFYWGGGGEKDYVPARTLRARNRTHFRQGSGARLSALEALGFVNALIYRAI